MDDVFAVEEPPPTGWMRAIFNGGPYDSDVGRCVPGPPPPKKVSARGGRGSCTYYLLSVGSWSDPSDLIGIYVAGRLSFAWARLRRVVDQTGITYRLRRLRARLSDR